jgi:hypothetical protein
MATPLTPGELLQAKLAEAERQLCDQGYDQELAALKRLHPGLGSWRLLHEELELMFRLNFSRNDLGFVIRMKPSTIAR